MIDIVCRHGQPARDNVGPSVLENLAQATLRQTQPASWFSLFPFQPAPVKPGCMLVVGFDAGSERGDRTAAVTVERSGAASDHRRVLSFEITDITFAPSREVAARPKREGLIPFTYAP
ncbi:MAG: hypothetical protein P4L82_12040 [Ancalomicrobiaceae bacterium]|nr:hypothetical protein [Ancalomicrobiaceae bacterium]